MTKMMLCVENSVDALTHSWDVELEEDAPVRIFSDCGFQNSKFLLPCASLLFFQRERILRAQYTEESIVLSRRNSATGAR